jgi:hypothetical protein
MRTKILICLSIIFLTEVLCGGCITPPPNTISEVYTYSDSYYLLVGESFTIAIICKATEPINGFETKLTFNSSICRVTDYEWSRFFPDGSSFYSNPVVDNINGTVTEVFAVSLMDGINTTDWVITFTFESINKGDCGITLQDTMIVNSTSELPIIITDRNFIVAG